MRQDYHTLDLMSVVEDVLEDRQAGRRGRSAARSSGRHLRAEPYLEVRLLVGQTFVNNGRIGVVCSKKVIVCVLF